MPGETEKRPEEKRTRIIPPSERRSITTTTSTGRTVVDANVLFEQEDVRQMLQFLKEHREAILRRGIDNGSI